MFIVGIGHSDDIESGDAITEVLEQCKNTLGECHPQAGILFSAIDHDHDLILKKIKESYPEIELIGCTTDGEMSSVLGFTEDAISLTLIYSDKLEIKAGVANNVSENPEEYIIKAVEETTSGLENDPGLCITAPSGLTTNLTLVINAFKQSLGEDFPIFGGTAADQWVFKGTYQFCNDQVFSDAVPFLLFSGPIIYSFSVKSGTVPIGEKTTITKMDSNIVYEIGGTTAVDYYRQFLGEGDLDFSGEYPLAVFEDNEKDFYLRAPFSFDEEKGAITFAGEIPVGAAVQITHTDRDSIIKAAKTSCQQAFSEYSGNKPSVLFCFSCAARKQILGTRVSEEYEIMNNEIPGLTVAGFYSYGEISPVQRGFPTRFHNETFVSLLLGTE